MADPIIYVITTVDGFSYELPTRFKPETYMPSTGGQASLYRAYGSTKVVQNSDSLGTPLPLRLKALLDAKDEVTLMDDLEYYTQMVRKAVSIARVGALWESHTLIRGANYVEAEVLSKAKRIQLTLVLIPDKLVTPITLLGGV